MTSSPARATSGFGRLSLVQHAGVMLLILTVVWGLVKTTTWFPTSALAMMPIIWGVYIAVVLLFRGRAKSDGEEKP